MLLLLDGFVLISSFHTSFSVATKNMFNWIPLPHVMVVVFDPCPIIPYSVSV